MGITISGEGLPSLFWARPGDGMLGHRTQTFEAGCLTTPRERLTMLRAYSNHE